MPSLWQPLQLPKGGKLDINMDIYYKVAHRPQSEYLPPKNHALENGLCYSRQYLK